jgi:hypothetical protein
MAALPITEVRQQYRELNEEFIENIGRRFLSRLPAAMTTEQRQAAIESTAALIRDVDALIARVDLVDGNAQAASEANVVRNHLKGLRAVVFTAMYTLNPEQAWFWTEEWQRKEREADEDIASGRTRFHAGTEDFFAALDARRASHAHT